MYEEKDNIVKFIPNYTDDDFIRISKLPRKDEKFNFQRNISFKKILVAGSIGLAIVGGSIAFNAIQHQNMEKATEIAYSVEMEIPNLQGYKLEIQKGGTAYFSDQNGRHFASVDGISAQEYANAYINNGVVSLETVQNAHVK